MIKKIIPPIAMPFLKEVSRAFRSRVNNRIIYKRLVELISSVPEIEKFFPGEKFNRHYVYEPMRQTKDHPDLFINQVRYYRIFRFFSENYPQLFNNKISIADIGDTSGILLSAMKKKGCSVNINPDIVDYINRSGIEAKIGDIESLPFKDKYFDFSFCFQCLEHVFNPVRALQELSRVTKNKIFLSIPLVETTIIYDAHYWKDMKSKSAENGGWSVSNVRDVDCHKFEFSTGDFKKLLSHSSLRHCDNFPINYFKPLGSTRKNENSYFNFFILEPL